VNKDDDDYSFLAKPEDTDDYINRKRDGTFVMGAKTGLPTLDKYFRFKQAQLDMIIGHDNAGKSVVSWYFSVLDCLLNDQRYIIYAGENKTGAVKCKLMEFYLCMSIESMNELQFKKAKAWVEDRYAFIANDEIWSYMDMINIGWKLLRKKAYTKFIVEPYNVLDKQTTNEHQYDYRAMLDFRLFIRKSGIGLLLNVHASTEALRRVYSREHEFAGYVMPPNKSDAEGGGKFPNKSDNFICVHRMADHPEEWVWTEIHIQKIKEYETGGQRTFKAEPVKLRMCQGGYGFVDINGFNPIVDYHQKHTKDVELPLQPNDEFLKPTPQPLVNKEVIVADRSDFEEEDDQPF
jgi:hypothetical protein